MKKFDVRKATRRLLSENKQGEPSMFSYIQAIQENLNNLVPRSQTDGRRLEMALEALRGIRRGYRKLKEENRRLQEQNTMLEEKLTILQEGGE